MDYAGNVTQDGQEDVDEEVAVATLLEEDTQWGEDDGKQDLADITVPRLESVFWFFLRPTTLQMSCGPEALSQPPAGPELRELPDGRR